MEEVVKALREGRREDVVKYMKRAVFLTSEIVDDAKKLLSYMGVPWVQAPSEGRHKLPTWLCGGTAGEWGVKTTTLYSSALHV